MACTASRAVTGGHNDVKEMRDVETLTYDGSNVKKLTEDAAFRRFFPSIADNISNSNTQQLEVHQKINDLL